MIFVKFILIVSRIDTCCLKLELARDLGSIKVFRPSARIMVSDTRAEEYAIIPELRPLRADDS